MVLLWRSNSTPGLLSRLLFPSMLFKERTELLPAKSRLSYYAHTTQLYLQLSNKPISLLSLLFCFTFIYFSHQELINYPIHLIQSFTSSSNNPVKLFLPATNASNLETIKLLGVLVSEGVLSGVQCSEHLLNWHNDIFEETNTRPKSLLTSSVSEAKDEEWL